jgi:hypothetical protein
MRRVRRREETWHNYWPVANSSGRRKHIVGNEAAVCRLMLAWNYATGHLILKPTRVKIRRIMGRSACLDTKKNAHDQSMSTRPLPMPDSKIHTPITRPTSYPNVLRMCPTLSKSGKSCPLPLHQPSLSRRDLCRILVLTLALPVLEVTYTIRAKIEIHSGR